MKKCVRSRSLRSILYLKIEDSTFNTLKTDNAVIQVICTQTSGKSWKTTNNTTMAHMQMHITRLYSINVAQT